MPLASSLAVQGRAIFRTCPRGDVLRPFLTPHDTFTCDVCHARMPLSTLLYGCRMCDWDACPACYSAMIPPAHFWTACEHSGTFAPEAVPQHGLIPSVAPAHVAHFTQGD